MWGANRQTATHQGALARSPSPLTCSRAGSCSAGIPSRERGEGRAAPACHYGAAGNGMGCRGMGRDGGGRGCTQSEGRGGKGQPKRCGTEFAHEISLSLIGSPARTRRAGIGKTPWRNRAFPGPREANLRAPRCAYTNAHKSRPLRNTPRHREAALAAVAIQRQHQRLASGLLRFAPNDGERPGLTAWY